MAQQTYRTALPETYIQGLYPGDFTADGPDMSGWETADVGVSVLNDINAELAARGWKHEGSNDQRPARPTITQTYSTTDTTFPAYTPDVESSAYNGINGALGTNCMSVTDGNALRVAVENGRAHNEAQGKIINIILNVLRAHGLIQ